MKIAKMYLGVMQASKKLNGFDVEVSASSCLFNLALKCDHRDFAEKYAMTVCKETFPEENGYHDHNTEIKEISMKRIEEFIKLDGRKILFSKKVLILLLILYLVFLFVIRLI